MSGSVNDSRPVFTQIQAPSKSEPWRPTGRRWPRTLVPCSFGVYVGRTSGASVPFRACYPESRRGELKVKGEGEDAFLSLSPR
jgi:hypothetical protein